MICQKCHYDNQDSNKTCVSCGSSLTDKNISLKEVFIKSKKFLRKIDFYSLVDTVIALVWIFGGITLILFLLSLAFTTEGILIKIVIAPFLICSIGVFIQGIERLVNDIKIIREYRNGNIGESKILASNSGYSSIGNNIYYFGFFLFWFGLLIIGDYFSIKTWSNGGSYFFFSSLSFWIVGIYILLKKIKG